MLEIKVLSGSEGEEISPQRPPIDGDWVKKVKGNSVIICQYFTPVTSDEIRAESTTEE